MTKQEDNPQRVVYQEGQIVDELKPHFKLGTNIPCDIKRGRITGTSPDTKTAVITCECGTMVKEAV